MIWLYRPVIKGVLKAKTFTILVALVVLGASYWPASKLGSEFMPNLNEGTLMYMPTTLPGLSVTKAAELLQTQNKIIKTFPEVAVGVRQSGTRQQCNRSRPNRDDRDRDQSEAAGSEWRSGVTVDTLIAEMDKSLQFPGVSNAWTMPIKARIDMLSTGIRTPVGIKVFGPDLKDH